ncbi:MAG: SagB/ThcOx family dehydrogenase, partial [Phycisphaerales bacterium]|nr:SagB/ThcOx family dehydrogenase [Phycisphaerales bacterium]
MAAFFIRSSIFDLRYSSFDILMNQPWEIAATYHEGTKHYFHRSARSLGYLDWATQPDPFRRFDGAPLVPLGFRRDDTRPAFDDLFIPGAIEAKPVTVESISSLFELSLGLSAWKELQDSRWALRINPSSGNLHPTEGYLVVGPLPGLCDHAGVYHYAPKEHALERRAEFDASLWTTMADRFPQESFLVALTSIHWREAWKYGERAYRYCQHDVGHALAAVAISAAVLGWRAVMIHGAGDDAIASLLGLDRESDFADAEQEQPDLLLAVMAGPRDAGEAPNFCSTHLSTEAIRAVAGGANWLGRANRLSADHVDWEIIDEVAGACARSSGVSPDRCPPKSVEYADGGAVLDHAGQPNRPAA